MKYTYKFTATKTKNMKIQITINQLKFDPRTVGYHTLISRTAYFN